MEHLEQQSLAQRLHLDLPLCLGLCLLCGLGLLILYSASNRDLGMMLKQVLHISIAFTLMLLVAQLSVTELARWSPWIFLACIILLLLVLWTGDTGKGAQRWLDLKFLRFQPSELMKLALPMMIARYIADRKLPPSITDVAVIGVMVSIPTVIIAKQPDLGTAILVAVSGLSVLFIAGIRWHLLMASGIVCALCAPVLWNIMHDYQKRRILTLFSPEQDPLGSGYHIIQATIATGSGGIYGKGWLNGTQSHLDFLPERSTDFIFAVYAEEFGLLGALLLLSIYLAIIGRGLYIAANAQYAFGKLLAAALTLTFFVYVFVNLSMVVGQLPVVGLPLPLISYGGSSMVTLMLAFGMLMSIQNHRRLLSG